MTYVSTVFLACVAAVSCGAASAQAIVAPDLAKVVQSISSAGDRRVELGVKDPNGIGALHLPVSSAAAITAVNQSGAADAGSGFTIRESLAPSTNPVFSSFPGGLNALANTLAAAGNGGADAAPPVQMLIGFSGSAANLAAVAASGTSVTPVTIGK